jgi:hypothetical protein
MTEKKIEINKEKEMIMDIGAVISIKLRKNKDLVMETGKGREKDKDLLKGKDKNRDKNRNKNKDKNSDKGKEKEKNKDRENKESNYNNDKRVIGREQIDSQIIILEQFIHDYHFVYKYII